MAGNGESGDRHAIGKVERADLGSDLEADRIAGGDRRNEVEADAIFLELNRNRSGGGPADPCTTG